MIIGFGLASTLTAIIPPIRIPPTKNKFQTSRVHSYLKNGIFAGMHAAQMWRREDEIPNDLFPRINKIGTVSPISGPAIYHGQGFFKMSIMLCKLLYKCMIKPYIINLSFQENSLDNQVTNVSKKLLHDFGLADKISFRQ